VGKIKNHKLNLKTNKQIKIKKLSVKMVLKVGINGFGRIGRLVLRASVENKAGQA